MDTKLKSIEAIDPNFKVKETEDKENLRYYSATQAPFALLGVFEEEGLLRRVPREVAEQVSNRVATLATHTAGGRVRFRTDSTTVAIRVKMPAISRMSHFALSGSAGLDLYEREDGSFFYRKTFVPPKAMEDGYESSFSFSKKKMRELMIHLPLYSAVSSLEIGLDSEAVPMPSTPYQMSTPVVFYGSSITQGGCASRPGMAYSAILSRRLDVDILNLGFSGSARGEDAMAEYVAGLAQSVFVYDYDHNAPTAEFLQQTHEKMFLTVREKQPDLPILMLSRPKYRLSDEEKRRQEIIFTTYENAVKRGDRNSFFLGGRDLMAQCREEGTVDGCHPTDFGFASMASALEEPLRRLLQSR